MNKERVLELADLIESTDEVHFNMIDYCWHEEEAREVNVCGTASCVAGYANYLESAADSGLSPLEIKISPQGAFRRAQAWLDLYSEEHEGGIDGLADDLFIPVAEQLYTQEELDSDSMPLRINLETIKKAHAVRVLRKLAETGEVDWVGTRGDLYA